LKIIITGASGWLGRNSIRYFLNNGLKLENLILIGSYNRELQIFKGLNVQIETFEEVIKSKKYSIIDGIVHLAYLTRDKIEGNVEEYKKNNLRITNQLFDLLETKPKWLTYVSSGAIYSKFNSPIIETNETSNPYGFLKIQDERKLTEYCQDKSINLSIGRLWGASGRDFINPSKYAFGEFILKAVANLDINILSPRKVFRKFCDSEQFMEICIRTAQKNHLTVFNSGGELVEIEELANLIAHTLNAKINVGREYFDAKAEPDDYYSRDESYFILAKSLDVKLLSLRDQIIKTSNFLVENT
jgi:nucleoside-diphosphate-sugar epimerase